MLNFIVGIVIGVVVTVISVGVFIYRSFRNWGGF